MEIFLGLRQVADAARSLANVDQAAFGAPADVQMRDRGGNLRFASSSSKGGQQLRDSSAPNTDCITKAARYSAGRQENPLPTRSRV